MVTLDHEVGERTALAERDALRAAELPARGDVDHQQLVPEGLHPARADDRGHVVGAARVLHDLQLAGAAVGAVFLDVLRRARGTPGQRGSGKESSGPFASHRGKGIRM
jgi:hypothetical protein